METESTDEAKRDTVIERYEALVLWGIVAPAIVIAICTFIFIEDVIDTSIFVSIAFWSTVLMVSVFPVPGIFSYLKYGRFPWQRQYLVTFILSLIFFPALGCISVLAVNQFFDTSDPVDHNTVVVGKSKPGKAKTLILKSWRSDMTTIEISVGPEEYHKHYIKEPVTVRTKAGFLGLEYVLRNR